MRVIGRYFAIGATLGSVSSLVTLVLIWGWMTIHLGLLGFALGWIPAGLTAGLLWLAMVVFWGPVLVVGAMVAAALVVLTSHHPHGRAWREPPAVASPEERLAPAPEPNEPQTESPGAEAPAEPITPPAREAETAPPAPRTPLPPIGPSPAPLTPSQEPGASPPASAAPKAPPTTRQRPSDDLGGDAAAAGDTSRKPRR